MRKRTTAYVMYNVLAKCSYARQELGISKFLCINIPFSYNFKHMHIFLSTPRFLHYHVITDAQAPDSCGLIKIHLVFFSVQRRFSFCEPRLQMVQASGPAVAYAEHQAGERPKARFPDRIGTPDHVDGEGGIHPRKTGRRVPIRRPYVPHEHEQRLQQQQQQ